VRTLYNRDRLQAGLLTPVLVVKLTIEQKHSVQSESLKTTETVNNGIDSKLELELTKMQKTPYWFRSSI
jgi:hypothetical protein